jgi:hypothetical protein
MIPIHYSVQRNVPASTRQGGIEDRHIALVVFAHPQTGDPQTLCVNEDMIWAEAGPDGHKQRAVIEREVKTVVAQMTAGGEFLPILQ